MRLGQLITKSAKGPCPFALLSGSHSHFCSLALLTTLCCLCWSRARWRAWLLDYKQLPVNAAPRNLPSTRPAPSLKRVLRSRAQAETSSDSSTAGDVPASSRLSHQVGRAGAIWSRSVGLLEAAGAASCSIWSFCCQLPCYLPTTRRAASMCPDGIRVCSEGARRLVEPPWRPVAAGSTPFRAACALCERRGSGGA